MLYAHNGGKLPVYRAAVRGPGSTSRAFSARSTKVSTLVGRTSSTLHFPLQLVSGGRGRKPFVGLRPDRTSDVVPIFGEQSCRIVLGHLTLPVCRPDEGNRRAHRCCITPSVTLRRPRTSQKTRVSMFANRMAWVPPGAAPLPCAALPGAFYLRLLVSTTALSTTCVPRMPTATGDLTTGKKSGNRSPRPESSYV